MCMRVHTSTSGQGASLTKFNLKEIIMSIESARAFVEKMRKDSEFKQQILAAESAAKRKELIKSAGFDFERMHLDSLVSKLTSEERDALMLL
jgi:predicted ribosomally synthesized peptide with nif11-like leader